MNRRLILLILVPFLLAFRPALAAPLHSLPSEHFLFYFDSEKIYKVDDVQRSAEAAYERLRQDFSGWTPPASKKIPVYLFADRRDFLKATGSSRTEMVVGMATSSDEAIRIDASELFTAPETVIGHELTHIFLFHYLGANVGSLPLWLNEGLAQEAGGAPTQNARIATEDAYMKGRLLTLAQLSQNFPTDNDAAGLAYAEAQDAAAWLLDQGGWHRMFVMLDALRRGGTFENALQSIYSLTPADLESGWRRSIRSSARPRMWGDVGGAVIVVAMLGALGWGFVTVQRHRRRQSREEEEIPSTEAPAWWPSDEEWRG